MKKVLLGTSAIAVVGAFAGEAKAVEWDVDWGGFFNSHAVYTSEDGVATGVDGFDVLYNGEIIFTPEVVLDNGLTFGAKVEMETDAIDSGEIDEAVAYLESSFGRIEIGSEDGAYARMFRGGGGSTTRGIFGVYSGTMTGTYLAGAYGASNNSGQIAGAAVRINYFTPRFAGFQLGASYARGTSANDRFFENTSTTTSDVVSLGANYVNSFGNMDLELAAGYETADAVAPAADPDRWHVGAAVGFGGLTIGGAYAHRDDTDVDFFDVGVAYDTGPWGMSFNYSLDDGGNEVSQYVAGVQYALGAGVSLRGSAGYADADNINVDGFTIGTGFNLSF